MAGSRLTPYDKVHTFCCKMRAKFLIGIVGSDNSVEISDVDLADFVSDWSSFDKPVINIKFCPFCGEKSTTALNNCEVR